MSENRARMSELTDGVLDADAARLMAEMTGCPYAMGWTVAAVRARLEEAARTWERIGGRVGPRRESGAWPDWELYGNPTDADLNCIYDGDQSGTRAAEARNAWRPSGVELSRVEDALHWPSRYLSDPKHDGNRRALQVWMLCCAKNRSFDGFLRRRGAVRQTAYRRLNRAAQSILDGLVRDGVLP